MFTGLIEEVGTVKNILKNTLGAIIKINASFSKELLIGDSVAVNGVCTTVVNKTDVDFSVELSNQTLKVSNLSSIKNNDKVNLERALLVSQRFNGHIVSGHVDTTTFLSSIKNDGLATFYTFLLNDEHQKYIIEKGSITINGVSLTIVEVDKNSFKVCIIPHTAAKTNISNLKINDIVNIEFDIIGKYVEKMLFDKNNKKKSIDENFLKEKGFF